MTDLGAALRRAGQPTESRAILRHALDLAHRHGAFALTERSRTERVAAGRRPQRLVLSGPGALTSSERRAAQLAAVGLSNREIAQNLFVTTRTVEGHLTHAYQKLAITSREQLPISLAPPDSWPIAHAPASGRVIITIHHHGSHGRRGGLNGVRLRQLSAHVGTGGGARE